MRSPLWNALRHLDSERAATLLSRMIENEGGLDGHLVMAGLELARLGRRDALAQLASRQGPTELAALVETTSRYLRHDWPGVLAARAARRLAVPPEGDHEALIDCLAILAAQNIEDDYRARSLAQESLAAWPHFPLVLYLALKIDLNSNFLDCPDLLLIDLSAETEKPAPDRYLETAWPAVTQAISAWFHHRDERRDLAQNCLTAFLKASEGCPVDIVLAAPFLHKMDPAWAAKFLDGRVPVRTSFGIDVHLRFNQLSLEKRVAVVQEGLRADPDHPYFQYTEVRTRESTGTRDDYLRGLAQLREALPWYQVVLRESISASLLENDHAGALRLAEELLAQAASWYEAYDWVVKCMRETHDERLLADFVVLALADPRWSLSLQGVREQEALYYLANAGRHAAVRELLNRLCALGEPSELVESLQGRGVRLALESLPSYEGLTARTLVACGLMSLYFGIGDVASAFLERLQELGVEERGAQSNWVGLLSDYMWIAPQLRSEEPTADLVAATLELTKRINPQETISFVSLQVLRLRNRGQFHLCRILLQSAIETCPDPELLIVAASALADELNDPSEALALLDRWHELGAAEPDVSLVRCEVLEKLGRVDDWLALAREGQARFPDRRVPFQVEEGLALAVQGEAVEAVARLSEGLSEDPTNERGIKGFTPLAVRFNAHESLATVLQRAVEQEPGNGEHRDGLLSILGAIESHQRDRLFHLYRRVYREREEDEERWKSRRATLAVLRHRLLGKDGVSDTRLPAFVDENQAKVRQVIAEAQTLLGGSILASVFTEIPVRATAQENEERSISLVPGLLILVNRRLYSEVERESTKNVIRSLLADVDYRGAVEEIDLEDLWQSLRRADRSTLERLLAGVAVEDFPFLGALRLLHRHCGLLVERLEKQLICYVVAGSFVRGSHRIASDIDAWIVIDDSDGRMNSKDLEKVTQINDELAAQARAEQAASRHLHVQVYPLSDYWSSLQRIDPVVLSLLRDGVPLHDRGLFNAWFHLLAEGRLAATRESLDAQLEKVQEWHNWASSSLQKLARELQNPVKYGTVKMLEVLLQVLDLPVGHYREVVEMARRELVEKRGLLSQEDLAVAQRSIDYYKAIEAGAVPRAEEGLALFRRVEVLTHKTRSLYRQLMFLRQRSQVEEVVLRIESALEAGGANESEGRRYWRSRLVGFRDDARGVLAGHEGGGLEALRMTALANRISDIAPGLALFETVERAAPEVSP